MQSKLRHYSAAAAGVASALLVMELVLRPLSSANLPPIATPSRDYLTTPSVTTRQLEEGIAESHFSLAGARLTGNPSLPDAATIVILGDSHVAAREIRDSETMGAWVERLARKDLQLVNVRQYGWRGASPPQYLLSARDILERWNPTQVVVVLDGDDLGPDPLNRRYPRMRIVGNDSLEIVPDPAKKNAQAPRHHIFTLASMLRLRWQQVIERSPKSVRYWLGAELEPRGPQPDSASIAAVPRVEVKALSRAFGSRLLIVYTADVRATGGEKPDAGERRLLDACAQQNVRCISMRSLMLAARRNVFVVRGFPTTTLGVGHLNAVGHELVGRTIWSEIRQQDPPNTAQLAQR
jgi:hypothetical protein